MDSIHKTCNRCNKSKPLSEFNKRSASKDGHAYTCRSCASEYHKKWRKENAEYLRDYKRQYHRENAEKIRRRVRRWERENRDRVNERSAKYRERYPKKAKARTAVSNAVKLGKLPHISTQECIECGVQADHYHHHNGYGRKHHLDVVPMCQTCHFEEDGII